MSGSGLPQLLQGMPRIGTNPPSNGPIKPARNDREMRGLLPFLRDAWRLAPPYFRSEERWSARGLLGIIIVMNLALVGMNVVLNFWNREFFNALQNKDWDGFTSNCSFSTVTPTAG